MATPGLKVVMPGCADDAKGLLKSWRSAMTGRDSHPAPAAAPAHAGGAGRGVGSAAGEGRREAAKVRTLPSWRTRMRWVKANQAAEAVADEINVEVVDPRTLTPLDADTIAESVEKTGRLLVVHEAPERGGAGAESRG